MTVQHPNYNPVSETIKARFGADDTTTTVFPSVEYSLDVTKIVGLVMKLNILKLGGMDIRKCT